MSQSDGFLKREQQSSSRYTRKTGGIVFIMVIIVIVSVTMYIKNNVDGPTEILSLTADNFHNVTSVMMDSDVSACQKHLNNLQEKLPPYIKIINVISENGFTKCISVKFAVSAEELKKAYFTDTKNFDEIVEFLKTKNLATDEDLKEMLKDEREYKK